jgi:cell division protein FtsN
MSRVYDALQNAEADRATQLETRREADERGVAGVPVASSGAAAWWRGLIVGGVVGVVAATVTILSVLERAAPQIPMTGRHALQPAVEADMGHGPAAVEADTGHEPGPASVAAGPVPVAAQAGESPDDVPEAVPGESESPAVLASHPAAVGAAPPRRTFRVQVGAFKSRDNAVDLLARLTDQHLPVAIHRGRTAATPWVLQVGRYADRRVAAAAQAALASQGFPGFVVSSEN